MFGLMCDIDCSIFLYFLNLFLSDADLVTDSSLTEVQLIWWEFVKFKFLNWKQILISFLLNLNSYYEAELIGKDSSCAPKWTNITNLLILKKICVLRV